jgi:hypothetical protein
MPTPIEELTAAEMAESQRSKVLAIARHAAELGVVITPPPVAVPLGIPVAPAPEPVPAVIPIAPTVSKPLPPSFLLHLEEEVKDELAKENE